MIWKWTTLFLVPFGPYTDKNIPICRNCKNVNIQDNTCKLFGKMNVVSGELVYLSCSIARENTTICGEEGKYYYRYIPFTGGR